ncbi:MAG: AraC family transcriptional regulator [unclassified Hahellaceae]|nr:AraC family transcriptional regulator [Hahellaceae bacterium]|tara:strand:+ start:2784 stop:3587 length:804 start_codon:yes stop_codon:yes gene_type:complete
MMLLGIEDLYAGNDVECSRVWAVDTCYPKHTHEEYIVSANLRGFEKIWVDGRVEVVPAGYVTVYNPMTLQSSQFCHEGVDFISLHINAEAFRQVLKEYNLSSRDQYPALHQGAYRNDIVFKAITDYFLSVEDSREGREESLLWLLSTLLNDEVMDSKRESDVVRVAKDYMMSNLESRLSLDDLSTIVGLSKFHFVRSFRQQVGIAPVQYHMQLRLIEARRMLKAGLKPIDVMANLGFYDQSHFIKTFKKVMAITPELYLKTIANNIA